MKKGTVSSCYICLIFLILSGFIDFIIWRNFSHQLIWYIFCLAVFQKILCSSVVSWCYNRSREVHAEPESKRWGLVRWTTTCKRDRNHWWNHAACRETQKVFTQHHKDYADSFCHTQVRIVRCCSVVLHMAKFWLICFLSVQFQLFLHFLLQLTVLLHINVLVE